MAVRFDKGAKIRRWERAMMNPIRALKQIGGLMVSESKRAFKLQQFGKDPWKPRRVPNVYGIIADFFDGKKKPPKRRFEERNALIDTSRLLKSIAFRLVGIDAVVVGSNVPYANTMHRGGPTESLPITEQVQELMQEFLGTAKKPGPGAEWRDDLGFILNKAMRDQTLKGNVPARPFVGITKQTLADVEEAVGVHIFEAV